MTPTVTIDARHFHKAMRGFAKQVPYAIALALTRTAQDARDVVIRALGDDFTLRTKWLAKGLRFVRRAEKTNLSAGATVGSKDDFMRLQALGGERPKPGAVPQVGRGLPRSTRRAKTPKSKWPGALMEKDAFRGSPFGRQEAVWGRVQTKKTRGLKLLYVMADKVEIPKRWKFVPLVHKVAGERWQPNTIMAMQKALSTARRRG